MPRRPVIKLLFFPAKEGITPEQVYLKLKTGLSRTFKALPILRGTIKPVDHEHQQGRIVITEPYHTADKSLAWHDLRGNEALNYSDLARRYFPTHLDDRKESPYLINSNESLEAPPVFRAKLTIIQGGCVLAVGLNHAFTDDNGTTQILSVWCQLCQSESLASPVSTKLLSRDQLMREPGFAMAEEFPFLALDKSKTMDMAPKTSYYVAETLQGFLKSSLGLAIVVPKILADSLHRIIQPFASPQVLPRRSKVSTLLLFFSHEKLSELKALVSMEIRAKHPESWISTNDALVALLYCSFVEARTITNREKRDSPKGWMAPFNITKWWNNQKVDGCEEPKPALRVAVNARHLIRPQLPTNFIGNVLSSANVFVSPTEVTTTPEYVSHVAARIREEISGLTPSYLDRFLSALMSMSDLRTCLASTLGRSNFDLIVSSWRGQDVYNMGWDQVFGARCDRLRPVGCLSSGICIVVPEITGSACRTSPRGLEVLFCI